MNPHSLFSSLIAALWLAASTTAASAESLPVSVTPVSMQSSYDLERTYGGQLNPVRQSQFGFEFPGTIAAIQVEEGDEVKAGDILIRLDTAATQAALNAALADIENVRAGLQAQDARLALARASLRRYNDLVSKGHGSEQELDELQSQVRVQEAELRIAESRLKSASAASERARIALTKHTIHAPYDGIIQSRLADEGTIVSPGQVVLTMIERNRLEARIGVPEAMTTDLVKGRYYKLRSRNVSSDARFVGTLPVVDAVTGTVTALFEVTDSSLFAGSVAELLLTTTVDTEGTWLPLSALSESQRGLWSVLVVEETEGRQTVVARLVEIMHRGADQVYVRGTLKSGDLVVTGGTSRIVPGQEVRLAQTRQVF
ncbi:MAG: efflux RND transporter periplasmic adaptor subunit [Pseudomonadales bacterium]|nr:efflux RND transporter periplasmic adaptor subunit [Pseudomonadales bacterium]